MSFWEHLFDSPYKMREDINALRSAMAAETGGTSSTTRAVNHLARQVRRQELLMEALLGYLSEKSHLDPDEFARTVAQLDLADGFEDGRIGPDRIAKAPKCPFCGRPRNPNRDFCVYCGEEITDKDIELSKPVQIPAKEYVRCHKCFRRIEKEKSIRTIDGDFCSGCAPK
jgi:hypothetical protein